MKRKPKKTLVPETLVEPRINCAVQIGNRCYRIIFGSMPSPSYNVTCHVNSAEIHVAEFACVELLTRCITDLLEKEQTTNSKRAVR